MPRASEGYYLGVAPVTSDARGKTTIHKEGLRFAPEFGGAEMAGPYDPAYPTYQDPAWEAGYEGYYYDQGASPEGGQIAGNPSGMRNTGADFDNVDLVPGVPPIASFQGASVIVAATGVQDATNKAMSIMAGDGWIPVGQFGVSNQGNLFSVRGVFAGRPTRRRCPHHKSNWKCSKCATGWGKRACRKRARARLRYGKRWCSSANAHKYATGTVALHSKGKDVYAYVPALNKVRARGLALIALSNAGYGGKLARRSYTKKKCWLRHNPWPLSWAPGEGREGQAYTGDVRGWLIKYRLKKAFWPKKKMPVVVIKMPQFPTTPTPQTPPQPIPEPVTPTPPAPELCNWTKYANIPAGSMCDPATGSLTAIPGYWEQKAQEGQQQQPQKPPQIPMAPPQPRPPTHTGPPPGYPPYDYPPGQTDPAYDQFYDPAWDAGYDDWYYNDSVDAEGMVAAWDDQAPDWYWQGQSAHPDQAHDWGAQGLMEQSMSALVSDSFGESWLDDNYEDLMWGEEALYADVFEPGGFPAPAPSAAWFGEGAWQGDTDADVDTSGWNDPAGLDTAFARAAWQGDVDSDVDTDISFGQGPGYPDAEERMWDATIEDDPYADYF